MKTIKIVLFLLAVLTCSSILVNAQDQDLIREEYTKLKSKQTLVPGKGLAEPGLILLAESLWAF